MPDVIATRNYGRGGTEVLDMLVGFLYTMNERIFIHKMERRVLCRNQKNSVRK